MVPTPLQRLLEKISTLFCWRPPHFQGTYCAKSVQQLCYAIFRLCLSPPLLSRLVDTAVILCISERRSLFEPASEFIVHLGDLILSEDIMLEKVCLHPSAIYFVS